MNYKIKSKIVWKEECNLLLVLENNFVICQDSTLKCYDFNGIFLSEWILNDFIRYVKVFDEHNHHKCLFIGLKNGQVIVTFSELVVSN